MKAAELRAPCQDRSRRTLAAILDATEVLLEEELFDQLSVAAIMAEAGMAVGSFYRRFKAKDDLLPHLYGRYEEALAREVDSFLAAEEWVGVGLEARVEELVAFAVRIYRRRRGLWRAVLVHAIARPSAIGEESRDERARLVMRFIELLVERGDEIGHAEPRLAAEIAVTSLMSICKDRILLDTPGSRTRRRVSDARLQRELCRLVVGYLQIRR